MANKGDNMKNPAPNNSPKRLSAFLVEFSLEFLRNPITLATAIGIALANRMRPYLFPESEIIPEWAVWASSALVLSSALAVATKAVLGLRGKFQGSDLPAQ
jgi:hypothetical protein